ncbi:thialysine N-epsilon-acetyltransferase-like [Brachionichthys hirsutus]|uniref:thialysine N-epsilon-acetyltransferase-like n=1 Tax=Brachionichthys hirsutus TaxID=412623 RepID=UPI003604481D
MRKSLFFVCIRNVLSRQTKATRRQKRAENASGLSSVSLRRILTSFLFLFSNMNYKIRAAVKEDCKEIYRMIVELSVYEKVPDKVKITQEDLERDGFGQNPFFECLVAEVPEEHKSKEGRTAVGYALYACAYSTWNGRSICLEDLYVMQEFRGKGIGKGLLRKVAEEGKKKQCQKLQLTVLDWNKSAREFYAANGAVDITESEGRHVISFHGQNLDNLANEAPKD